MQQKARDDFSFILESESYEPIKSFEELTKYLEVTKNEIKAKRRAVVVIDTKNYKDEVEEYAEFFKLPGIIDIYFPDDGKIVTLPFLYDINLYKPESITQKKGEIVLEYQPGETIIKQKIKLNSMNFNTFRRILDGNAKFLKTPEQMVLALAELLNYSIDLVHFEIMVQQVFRCPDDVQKPCRLCSDDYSKCQFVGISQLPRKLSWVLGMSFERANLALKEALIKKLGLKNTPYEKIILDY